MKPYKNINKKKIKLNEFGQIIYANIFKKINFKYYNFSVPSFSCPCAVTLVRLVLKEKTNHMKMSFHFVIDIPNIVLLCKNVFIIIFHKYFTQFYNNEIQTYIINQVETSYLKSLDKIPIKVYNVINPDLSSYSTSLD